MKITLIPQRRNDDLQISKFGDVLTINGEVFDFSVIPDGATLPASAVNCDLIIGKLERIGGVLHLTILLPHGPTPSEAAAFPQPIINPPDGDLELPV